MKRGFKKENVLAMMVNKQAESAHQTTVHTKNPREKAEQAIHEIASMAEECGLLSNSLSDVTKRLSREAETAKETAVKCSDKVRSAVERLQSVDLAELERATAVAVAYVDAMERLEKFYQTGKYIELLDVLCTLARKEIR